MEKVKTQAPGSLRILFFACLCILVSGCIGFGFIRETSYTGGTYEGSGQGYRGPITVRLEVSQAGIEDIVIVSHNEAFYPGAAAIEELLDLVLETGSTDLDAVSGATFSSRGFLEAVEDALRKAVQDDGTR